MTTASEAPPARALDARLNPFLATPGVQFYRARTLAGAQRKVALEQVDMALDLRALPAQDWINPKSPKGRILQRVLAGTPGMRVVDQTVRGGTVRYVDWLAPGVFGMNLPGLPFAHSPHGLALALSLGAASSVAVYLALRRMGVSRST